MGFKEYLNEKLITFNKKAYPKFGNVVILAGGAGSGKGFVRSNLLGIEGHTFDVDAMKSLVMNSWKLSKKIKDETGKDVKSFNLKNPKDVSSIHSIVKKYHLDDKWEHKTFKSILLSDASRKPNLIFDVTLKDITKLYNLSNDIEELGYDKNNIHIVWVINDVEIAVEQNKERSRTVPEEILLDTHKGSAMTMKDILDMGSKLKKFMDGDIWFSFNKIDVDTKVNKSKIENDSNVRISKSGSKKQGSYIEEANYIKVKEAGKKQLSSKDISKKLYDKIASYTPEINKW